jgi:hypothetical protein
MEYEELKSKLKCLGMNMKEFTSFVGVHTNTATRWKNNYVPLWVEKVIEGLECKKEVKRLEDHIKRFCSADHE